MRKFLKSLPKEIVLDVIKSLIGTAIIAFGGYILKEIAEAKFEKVAEYSWALWIILIGSVLWSLIHAYLKFNKLRPYFPPIHANFQLLEKEITHKYKNSSEVIHTRRFKVKCLRNATRVFSDKFFWTGGNYSLSVLNKKYALTETGKVNMYNTYEVRFDRALKKGEIIDIVVEWQCENNNAVPFFSTTIEQPTDKLIMNLNLDESLNVKEASFEEAYTKGAPIPTIYEVKELKSGLATWTLDNPKLLYHYEVRWAF